MISFWASIIDFRMKMAIMSDLYSDVWVFSEEEFEGLEGTAKIYLTKVDLVIWETI